MTPVRLKRAIALLVYSGCTVTVVGTIVYALGGPNWAVSVLLGVAMMLMVVGCALDTTLQKSDVSMQPAEPMTGRPEIDLRLVNLAQTLRRPFFQLRQIILVISLIASSIASAWIFKTAWPLIGLLFPAAFVITTAFANLARNYHAIRQTLIQQLSDADQKAFLDLLSRSGHQG